MTGEPPAPPAPRGDGPFASRAGEKLDHALSAFGLEVRGLRCADFGANVGGFVDCLLRRGAASVVALDTGYGTLAWRLRKDPRVTVRERTNALHAEPPAEGVDLVTVDLAWTPQRHAIPAALRWLARDGRIVTLVKPHYELEADERSRLDRGALAPEDAEAVCRRVLEALPSLGAEVLGCVASPLVGGKSARGDGRGNREFLVLLRARADAPREAARTSG